MTSSFHKYLVSVLDKYKLSKTDFKEIKYVFDDVWQELQAIHTYNPRPYYAGSYAKKTMIKGKYDLDIVIYFPHDLNLSVEEIYNLVKETLIDKGFEIYEYGIALQIFYDEFDIDIVPAKAINKDFEYANAYNVRYNKKKRTSLKKQVESVDDIQSIIKLMKIWRNKHNLKWHKLAMEQLVVKSLQKVDKNDFGNCFEKIMQDIKSSILGIKFIDPANSNNVITVSEKERMRIKQKADFCFKEIKKGNYEIVLT